MKIGYTHVDENFTPSAPCRFCDDPSHTNGKGAIEQTDTAEDGRPLYAHPECDDPFEFANHLVTLETGKDLECPNCGAECDRPGLCSECSPFAQQSFEIQPNPVDSDFIAPRVFNSSKSALPTSTPQVFNSNPKVRPPKVDAETVVDATNMHDGETISPQQ